MAPRIRTAAVAGGYKGEIVENITSMSDVVRVASEKAVAGEVVLLSPACASFGMFKNYKERGVLFKQAVNSL
jgi:UDP-N-acetylmuramoylalanine--D-glutamate ligase